MPASNDGFIPKTNSVLELTQVFESVRLRIVQLENQVTALEGRPLPQPIPTTAQTAAALRASQFNVANLPGQLAQVQAAAIPIVTALPASGQQDQVVFFSGHLYHFQAGNPGSWTLIL